MLQKATGAHEYASYLASRADKDGSARPDWAHVYLAVLPLLPLHAVKDEAKIGVALR